MTRTDIADRIWAIARPLAWGLIAAVLVAPAVAMRFTSQVRWTALDFIVAAVMLIGAGLICEVFACRVKGGSARVLFSLGMAVIVALIWGAAIN